MFQAWKKFQKRVSLITSMDAAYILDCLDRGTNLYWRTLGNLPGMCLHTGEIEWVMSAPRGGVERIFNITLPSERASAAIDALIEMIKAEEAPSGILITPTNMKPEGLPRILEEKGFKIYPDTGSGMAMDIPASITSRKPSEQIQIIPVTDPEQLQAWVEIVNTALFGQRVLSFEQFLALWRLENTHFLLGLLDGRPASTCMTITSEDIATVEMVSTLAAFRNHGLGAAITTAALQGLPGLGVKTAILRAEKEAIHVYRRVGFEEYYKRAVAAYRG